MVKTATNPIMSVTVSERTSMSYRCSVPSQSKVPSANRAHVGQRNRVNRRPGQDSLANSSSDIFTHTRCIHVAFIRYISHISFTRQGLLSSHNVSGVLPSCRLKKEII